MADNDTEQMTTIAVNHVPEGWLSKPLAQAQGVTQTARGDGRLTVTLAKGSADGYVRPWAGVAKPDGDVVGVLLLASIDGLLPAGGASLESAGNLIWLRGGAAAYSHVMAVRAADLTGVELHAPDTGAFTLLRVGLFDMDSWTTMQTRGIIYFDGGGITQAASDGYILPPATAVTLGGVMIDTSTLSITPEGVLSALRQEIPVASADTLGGVKQGRGVQVSADGTLNARLGRNLNFDANGAIEAPDIEMPDMSDYVTKSGLTSTLDSYLTKELADATYAKKGETGGGGGGGTGGGGETTVDAYTKAEADARFQTKLTSASGNSSDTFKWFVRNGVCVVTLAVQFASGSVVSMGAVDSAYAPERELAFALTGGYCNGYAQIKTDGTITAVRTGGTTPPYGDYARGGISWGVSS